MISVTDYDGNIIEYTYNALNNIDTIRQNGTVVADYDYTAFGAIEKITHQNAMTETVYEYDDAMRITRKATTRFYDTGTFSDIEYIYDVLGNVIQKRGTERASYTYDALGRLTSETLPEGDVIEYTFDAGNNIMKKDISYPSHHTFSFVQNGTEYTLSNISMHSHTYAYNNANQLLMETENVIGTSADHSGYLEITKEYTYDKNGNMLKKETGGQSDKSVVEYTYNRLNQLTTFTAADGSVTNYGYDGTGMRVFKTQGDVTRKYYWDRGYVSNEGIGTNIVATNYIGAEGIFARDDGNEIDYLYKNAHGDVVSIDREEIKIRDYNYDAYGNHSSLEYLYDWEDNLIEPSEDTNPIRYCGEYYDEESGLIYLRNRYYAPEMGRFINEDPAKDGTNWYAYCENNPVMFVDPTGLFRIIEGEAYDKYQVGSGNINNQVNDYVSEDIKKMQIKLQELGYLDKSITWYGYFGNQTLAAVNAFKEDNNIQNNTEETKGIVGATTWALMGLDFDVIDFVGSTLSNVSMNRGVLRVDRNIVNADIVNTYYAAEAIKAAYKVAFGEEFNVTTASVYWELVGHIFADEVAEANKGGMLDPLWKIVQHSTGTIDIGDDVIVPDKNRWVWDLISRLGSK